MGWSLPGGCPLIQCVEKDTTPRKQRDFKLKCSMIAVGDRGRSLNESQTGFNHKKDVWERALESVQKDTSKICRHSSVFMILNYKFVQTKLNRNLALGLVKLQIKFNVRRPHTFATSNGFETRSSNHQNLLDM